MKSVLAGSLTLAVSALALASAGTAHSAPGLHRSAGKTINEVTQEAIAEGGHRLHDAKGKPNGSDLGHGTSQADAAKYVTPLQVLSAYGQLTSTAMAMFGTGSPTTTQQTTFQGPTNLNPAVGGAWDNFSIKMPGPIGAVHSIMLPTGKVLIMAGSGNQYQNLAAGKFYSWIWDPNNPNPATNFVQIPTPYDMFCSGHVILADGNVLIAGGTTAYPQFDSSGNLVHDFDGSKQAYVFNVSTSRYEQIGSMANARWYPGTLERGSGKVLIVGGLDDQARPLGVISHNTDTVEQYDPVTKTFTSLPSLDLSKTDPSYTVPKGATNTTRTMPFYPGLVQLEDGRVFYSGESNGDNGIRPGIWDPETGGYQSLAPPTENYTRNAGATVLLPPAQSQQVMIMGGGDYAMPSTKSTAIINLKGAGTPSNPTPAYVPGPALSAAKMYVGAVDLPNYKVFETNGASQFRQGGVHSAEMYDPVTRAFTVLNSPTLDRLYHSEGLLLPSGDVAVLGSQPLDGSYELNLSIYHPPYDYQGQRPAIAFGVKTLNYKGGNQGYYDITVAPGATLSKIALLRPSATTHSTDNDQRLVDLPFARSADGHAYTVQVPTNPNLIPPGQYMMFATDNLGRPSSALWVTVSPG